MRKIKVWNVYDVKGNCCGYFLPGEKALAMTWAKWHNGTYKSEYRLFG